MTYHTHTPRNFRSLLHAGIGFLLVSPIIAAAAEYDGPGLPGGVGAASGLVGSRPIRATIFRFLQVALSYLAMVAIVVIVVAGIRLIASNGEDTAKDAAKKTILYAVIGFIVIMLAQGVVFVFSVQIIP